MPGPHAAPPMPVASAFAAAIACVVAMGSTAGCHHATPCRGAACEATAFAAGSAALPTCPRDAARDASGRCACIAGDLPALGACVPPPVGDAFCGAGARIGPEGCAFRPCEPDEALDVAAGTCVPRATLEHAGALACTDAGAPLIEDGRAECVPSAAACPRGSTFEAGACVRPLDCPAGTLPLERSSCRALVTAGTHGRPRVDVGAWAALAFGVDGGSGSPYLCRPLAQRPAAFALAPGKKMSVRLRVTLTIPDQDLTAVHAHLEVVALEEVGEGSRRPLPTTGEDVARKAVASLVEPLRSLGGEASAAAVEVEVRCTVASL